MKTRIKLDADQMFYELNELAFDEELITLVQSCMERQKAIGQAKFSAYFRTDAQAKYYVSPEALARILEKGQDISDIRTNSDISNCIVFHTKNLDGSLVDEQVLDLRRRADHVIIERLGQVFEDSGRLDIEVSGHFWYPPGGFMGWHTNLRKPGWRMYVNYCEAVGQSFFRYRDPDTRNIVTCQDKNWNFRLFKITPAKPFWHCVYSGTNRFSLGYKIDLKDS